MSVEPRGAIRNREHAKQLRDFTDCGHNNITPTDIDAFFDFWNEIFIFVEAKYGEKPLPLGQLLALERLTDACWKAGKASYCLVGSHNTPSDQDVKYGAMPVVRYRFEGKWYEVDTGITLAEFKTNILYWHKQWPIEAAP